MNDSAKYPRRFGRYVLVAPLAKGGMGELHLAVAGKASFRKLCVVKQILSHLGDPDLVQRFADEAAMMVKLSHGNLVPTLESGTFDSQYFLAMEYVEGKNLRSIWNALQQQERNFPLNLALYVVKELCRGLGFVHTHGEMKLVHRDVSPPNVLISYSGEVKLADFGLALSARRMQKTEPGMLVGKLGYMSPEHARGEELDARADVYSAGIIYWELITGQRLFGSSGTQAEQLEQVMDPKIQPPSAAKADLPPVLDLIARQALSPDPKNRYQEAETMRQEVVTALAELDPTTDASSMKKFLEQLYGEEIEQERQKRAQMLEEMSPQIEALVSELTSGEVKAIERSPTAPGVSTPPEPIPEVLEPGYVLDDKYHIIKLLGEGGMGRVYHAVHLGIDREVALKILLPEFSQMSDVVKRFRREARTASRIGHPSVVEILDSGTTRSGQVYFAMEYLEGTDLAEVLRQERKLEINRALRIGVQICEAMAAAHESGVIHRDLKPENVFLVPSESTPDFVKLVDFGIAKFAQAKEGLTLPGLAMGTPEYMAPEQVDATYDHRVDIYATGVMLYEMLVGQVPHPGESFQEIFYSKAANRALSPRDKRPEIPEELDAVVLKALEYKAEDRLETMSQMSYQLRKLYEGRAAAVASVLNISGGLPVLKQEIVESEPQTAGGLLDASMDSGEVPAFDPYQVTAELPDELYQPRSFFSRSNMAIMAIGLVLVVGLVALVWYLAGRSGRSAAATPEVIEIGPFGPTGTNSPDASTKAAPGRKRRRSLRRRRPRRRTGRRQREKVKAETKTKTKEPLEGTMDPFKKQR